MFDPDFKLPWVFEYFQGKNQGLSGLKYNAERLYHPRGTAIRCTCDTQDKSILTQC